MKKLIVLAVASLFATSAIAGEMKWSGSAGWRYDGTKYDDNLGATSTAAGIANGKNVSQQKIKSHALRANLGVSGGWENVEWGFGMRTGGANATNSDWENVQAARDLGVDVEQAWFRYVRDFGSLDLAATFGRQMNVFASDGWSQQLFDNDVRFDGIGWQFKFGMFGLNASQYVLGAKSQGVNGASTHTSTEATKADPTTQSKFNTLFGFQPHMTWKFTDEIETMFAVGYYIWNDDSNTNATGGGYNSNTLNANSTKPAIPNGNGANGFRMHNPRQWQFFNTWTLPYKLSAQWEYVMNKESKYSTATLAGYTNGSRNVDVSKSAFALGLKYGDVKKAHDWSVSYVYGSKGIASTINAYANNLVLADNKGHTLNAAYALADNFHLGFKWFSMKEKEKKNVTDVAAAGNTSAQTSGVAYAGNQSQQEQATKYMELTAGVMF